MGLFGNKTEAQTDVVSVLKEDHEKLKDLFEKFEEAEDKRTKQQIVNAALTCLTVHAQVEEEIFYPAYREAQGNDEETDDLMDEALQEHHVAKMLIAELEDMGPGDEFYDAKFTVLSESVKHHMGEEESEIFPNVDEDDENWSEVGERLKTRRQQLMQGGGRAKGSSSKLAGNGKATKVARNGRAAENRGRQDSRAASKGTKKAAVSRRK